MFGLAGKLALVTGATAGMYRTSLIVSQRSKLVQLSHGDVLKSKVPVWCAGIGKAIAVKFAAVGATVLINGRTAARANATAEELNSSGVSGKAIGFAGDLSKPEGLDAVLSAIKATGKDLDILVCNVGVYGSKPFAETTDEEWDNYFQTNIMSTVRPCRALLPGMLERDNGGRVIIVSSESAFKPLPNMVAYSSTKAMQVNIARGLAELTKGTSVTVNSLMPGPTATEGVVGYFAGMAKEQGREREEVTKAYFHEHEPTSLKQKLLNPDEIANAALYLASPASSATNGSAMRAEGGIYRSV